MPKMSSLRSIFRTALTLVLFAEAGLAFPSRAGAQTADPAAPPTLQQGPFGVTPLPQDPPPTGQQAPLPTPAGAIPDPLKAMRSSPAAHTIVARLRTQPMSINDAVAIALSTNRQLTLAEESLRRAQGRTSETRAALNPTLGATGSYTRLDSGQSTTFGNRTVTIVNPDQPSLGLGATLPLDISGLLRTATQQAEFQEVVARLDVNRARNQAVLDVKSAFYDVLRDQALVNVAQSNLQASLDRLNDSSKRYRAGVVARFDVIRAQTDVANAQQQLITARSTVSSAFAALNSTIGIDVNVPVTITDQGAVENPPGVAPPSDLSVPAPPRPDGSDPDTTTSKEAPDHPSLPPITAPPETLIPPIVSDPIAFGPDYAAILTEAQATRPEILEGDANIAAARKGIQLARRSSLPTLGLTAGGYLQSDPRGIYSQTGDGPDRPCAQRADFRWRIHPSPRDGSASRRRHRRDEPKADGRPYQSGAAPGLSCAQPISGSRRGRESSGFPGTRGISTRAGPVHRRGIRHARHLSLAGSQRRPGGAGPGGKQSGERTVRL